MCFKHALNKPAAIQNRMSAENLLSSAHQSKRSHTKYWALAYGRFSLILYRYFLYFLVLSHENKMKCKKISSDDRYMIANSQGLYIAATAQHTEATSHKARD